MQTVFQAERMIKVPTVYFFPPRRANHTGYWSENRTRIQTLVTDVTRH